jgi:hypothetical protein
MHVNIERLTECLRVADADRFPLGVDNEILREELDGYRKALDAIITLVTGRRCGVRVDPYAAQALIIACHALAGRDWPDMDYADEDDPSAPLNPEIIALHAKIERLEIELRAERHNNEVHRREIERQRDALVRADQLLGDAIMIAEQIYPNSGGVNHHDLCMQAKRLMTDWEVYRKEAYKALKIAEELRSET